MYEAPMFAVEDRAELAGVIAAARIAELVTHGSAGLEASTIPMLWEDDGSEHGRLIGHLTRRNPQWSNVSDGSDALALFRTVDGYVTPSWYPSKAEHGKVVPTWNYVSVQVHGTLRVVQEPSDVDRIVRALTDHHERDRPQPWSVDDAPREFVEGLLGAIVGIELRITRLVGKAKLSQNRPLADALGVIDGFTGGSAADQQVAAAMRPIVDGRTDG